VIGPIFVTKLHFFIDPFFLMSSFSIVSTIFLFLGHTPASIHNHHLKSVQTSIQYYGVIQGIFQPMGPSGVLGISNSFWLGSDRGYFFGIQDQDLKIPVCLQKNLYRSAIYSTQLSMSFFA